MWRWIEAIAAVVVLLVYSLASPAQPPATFGAAKKLAADIHEAIGHQLTVYCGCPYGTCQRL